MPSAKACCMIKSDPSGKLKPAIRERSSDSSRVAYSLPCGENEFEVRAMLFFLVPRIPIDAS